MPRFIPGLLALCAYCQSGSTVVATSAANFQIGLPPPGSLASIFCTGLSVPAGVTAANQVPLPTSLAGVRVTIGGTPAPLFAVADFGSYQQINVQVPSESQSADIAIQSAGAAISVSSPFRPPPGDFFTNADGSGVFQHASDYSLVTPQHPARTGETIIAYLTGIAVPGLIATNTPAPSNPLVYVPQSNNAAVVNAYYVSVGGVSASPTFFGLAPGLIGVFQLNFTVPASVAQSAQKVSLVHYTCSGNFFGTCGVHNGYPVTVTGAPVTIPIE